MRKTVSVRNVLKVLHRIFFRGWRLSKIKYEKGENVASWYHIFIYPNIRQTYPPPQVTLQNMYPGGPGMYSRFKKN